MHKSRIFHLVATKGWLWAAGLMLLLPAGSARAWNPTGHMITAAFAYDQLPPEARVRLAAMLEANPDIAKWRAGMPKDVPGFDPARYLFMRASTWPDDIRKSGSSYDHPVWHYVDYPIQPPDFPLEPAPAEDDDILKAIALCEKTVADPAATPTERAAHLSWLIHLIGDLQQPLHCVTLVNATYPKPGGDHGGNLFNVSLGGVPVNLHFFWDSLPGSLLDGHEIIVRATQLETAFPRSALPELTKAADPQAWSLEGRALAIDAVYLRGKLPGGKEATIDLPALPAGYTSASRALSERRLALAGYRMADELEKLT